MSRIYVSDVTDDVTTPGSVVRVSDKVRNCTGTDIMQVVIIFAFHLICIIADVTNTGDMLSVKSGRVLPPVILDDQRQYHRWRLGRRMKAVRHFGCPSSTDHVWVCQRQFIASLAISASNGQRGLAE